jgi:cytochrome c2
MKIHTTHHAAAYREMTTLPTPRRCPNLTVLTIAASWIAVAGVTGWGFGTAALADPVQGERVFQRCTACHSLVASGDKLPGPNLKTVVGRRAGTLPDFDYSPAMIAAGAKDNVVWTRDALIKYLADPDDVVPGTAMQLPQPLSADERRDVVDYLEKAATP